MSDGLKNLTGRKRIAMKLAEIEHIARAMGSVNEKRANTKPTVPEDQLLSMLEFIRMQMVDLSELVR